MWITDSPTITALLQWLAENAGQLTGALDVLLVVAERDTADQGQQQASEAVPDQRFRSLAHHVPAPLLSCAWFVRQFALGWIRGNK